MAAWGSPVLPGGGQWSVMRAEPPDAAPCPVDAGRGVPLVRVGLAPAGPMPAAPYRFADPADLLHPAPVGDYGWVHATGTQRTFFPRPVINTMAPDRVVSDQRIAVADPYALATAPGFFPPLADTHPRPRSGVGAARGAGWLVPPRADRTRLCRPRRPAGDLRRGEDAHGRRLLRRRPCGWRSTPAAAVPWSFRLEQVDLAVSSGGLGEVIRVRVDHRCSGRPSDTLRASRLPVRRGPVARAGHHGVPQGPRPRHPTPRVDVEQAEAGGRRQGRSAGASST